MLTDWRHILVVVLVGIIAIDVEKFGLDNCKISEYFTTIHYLPSLNQ